MARLELTTNPGFEDVALDELRGLAGVEVRGVLRPGDLAGHLHVEAEVADEVLGAVAHRMRSIHRVVRPVAAFPLDRADPLGQVRREVARWAPAIAELAPETATFRASCARNGAHAFTSEDVERVAGAGVRDALPRAVRLKGGDVELRCDVRGDEVRLGVQTASALGQRAGPYRPTTTLRANVAWCLLALARPGGEAPRQLLDPFCGAGTVLTEAAATWPHVVLSGSDLHEACVVGAAENLAHAGLVADLRQGDARRLDELWPEGAFDTIVTDPPFGRRMGAGIDLSALYAAFLRSAARVATEDARLVLLAEKRGAVNRALRGSGWEIRHVRIVEIGGRYPGVFVLGRA